jgi:rhodanese-related sulfurtransferase
MAGSAQTAARSLPIGAEELKRRLQSGEAATILDVRSPNAWDASDAKMPGAIRADAADLRVDPAWPKNRLTIAYCT